MSNSKLNIYNEVKAVPANAKKDITGGRLKGKTDINPMWRLKALTEQFGPCGIGWKYEIVSQRLEEGANNEIAAFVDIKLYYKSDGEWSDAIPGTGGSMFVAKEKNGMHTSDECFKMALTDAISVSCKALGFGADVYWDKDKTKYDQPNEKPESTPPSDTATEAQVKKIFAMLKTAGGSEEKAKEHYKVGSLTELTKKQASELIEKLQAKIDEKESA